MELRLLVPADAGAYVVLRREMLEDSPWAFAASAEDDRALNADFIGAALAEPGQAIVGLFDGSGRLAGAAGLVRSRHVKMAHRAHMHGVYITPGLRGRGLGVLLVRRALDAARGWPGVTSVGLSASVNSPEARRVYEKAGFVAWGIEPGALRWGGRAFDEVHMVAGL